MGLVANRIWGNYKAGHGTCWSPQRDRLVHSMCHLASHMLCWCQSIPGHFTSQGGLWPACRHLLFLYMCGLAEPSCLLLPCHAPSSSHYLLVFTDSQLAASSCHWARERKTLKAVAWRKINFSLGHWQARSEAPPCSCWTSLSSSAS